MGLEQSVLTQVTQARANAVAGGAQGPAAQASAESALTGALRSLSRSSRARTSRRART